MNVNEYIEKYSHHHFQETPCGDCVKDAISIMEKLSKLTQQLKD